MFPLFCLINFLKDRNPWIKPSTSFQSFTSWILSAAFGYPKFLILILYFASLSGIGFLIPSFKFSFYQQQTNRMYFFGLLYKHKWVLIKFSKNTDCFLMMQFYYIFLSFVILKRGGNYKVPFSKQNQMQKRQIKKIASKQKFWWLFYRSFIKPERK